MWIPDTGERTASHPHQEFALATWEDGDAGTHENADVAAERLDGEFPDPARLLAVRWFAGSTFVVRRFVVRRFEPAN